MPRVRFHDFEEYGAEVARVYLAATMDESRRVEEALDRIEICYAVEIEPFATVNVFGAGSTTSGAAFYVLETDAPAAAATLRACGLARGLLDEER